jgi:7-carboxy-7-deazaguanine synthase
MKEHNETDMNTPVKNRTKEESEYIRPCDRLNIVDLFVSLQGEGKYVGIPSLFIRVSGCNLRCCFKNSICDTAYSSFNPEKGHFTKDDVVEKLISSNVTDIVITGGEPLMFREALDDLIEYIGMITDNDYRITVETNGTFGPLASVIDLYSISPKLSTSMPEPGRIYESVSGNKMMHHCFSEAEVKKLNETRHNPDAVTALTDMADFQLKFVYSNIDSLKDIDNFLDELRERCVNYEPDDIMLMPEGSTNEQLKKTQLECANICIERGWRFADRLHIRLWGDKRGV